MLQIHLSFLYHGFLSELDRMTKSAFHLRMSADRDAITFPTLLIICGRHIKSLSPLRGVSVSKVGAGIAKAADTITAMKDKILKKCIGEKIRKW